MGTPLTNWEVGCTCLIFLFARVESGCLFARMTNEAIDALCLQGWICFGWCCFGELFCLNISVFLFVLIPPHFFPPLSVSAPASKMVRAALVTATSLALTGAVVAHAYLLKHQFYPTVVYLTKSSPSMAVRPAAVLLFISFLKSYYYLEIWLLFIADIGIRQISFCLLFCFWHQVLYIQAFVLVFLLGKFMRKVFFGQLRAAEMEVEICFFHYLL